MTLPSVGRRQVGGSHQFTVSQALLGFPAKFLSLCLSNKHFHHCLFPGEGRWGVLEPWLSHCPVGFLVGPKVKNRQAIATSLAVVRTWFRERSGYESSVVLS